MATTFADGVILGADSRTTSGAYIVNRVTDKLTQLTDSIWCCRSGSAADTQAIADIVAYHLSMYESVFGEKPTTKTAAAIMQELLYSNRDMLMFVTQLPPPSLPHNTYPTLLPFGDRSSSRYTNHLFFSHRLYRASIILAGYDRQNGGQVYTFPLGGSIHRGPYALGGSGSGYITAYCAANWKENMSEAESIEFVKNSVRLALTFDGSSGGVVRLVVLRNDGTVRHVFLPDTDYTGPGVY